MKFTFTPKQKVQLAFNAAVWTFIVSAVFKVVEFLVSGRGLLTWDSSEKALLIGLFVLLFTRLYYVAMKNVQTIYDAMIEEEIKKKKKAGFKGTNQKDNK